MGDQKIVLGKKTFYLCQMCRGMFTIRKLDAGTITETTQFGRCFGNAPHIFFPGNSYQLARSVKYKELEGYQTSWRECNICQCLYFDRKSNQPASSGTCFFDGSGHFPKLTKIYKDGKPIGVRFPVDYQLRHFSEFIEHPFMTWWRWCRKCEMLFYPKGGESAIFCPAGGNHDASESGYYQPEEASFYF